MELDAETLFDLQLPFVPQIDGDVGLLARHVGAPDDVGVVAAGVIFAGAAISIGECAGIDE